MTQKMEESPTHCAICGTSLLDKPRLDDMCIPCDFNVSHRGDPNILTQSDEGDETWTSEEKL